MKKFFKILGGLLVIIIIGIVTGAVYLKTMLPNVGPAPEITIEATPARIQRGEYLANHVTVCMDCHSSRAKDLYAGPLLPENFGGGGEKFAQDMGFPGTFYSPNITPYSLAKWTDGEIFRAITTGVNKDGKALFPVMPYHSYGQIDQEDIYSIIAYLRSLPAVTNDVPESKADFPVNFIINTLPTEAHLTKRPSEQDQLAYGKYLVTAAGCVECHSKMDKGSRVSGSEYGGGMEFPGSAGIVRSPNITPDANTGIGAWTEEAFVTRFKIYADSSYQAPKVGSKDMNTPMPWMMYAGMREDDLKAIFTYLKSLKPIQNSVERFTPAK